MASETQTPYRAQGIFAVVGGLLAVISFFLPSSVSVTSGTTPPYTAGDYTLVSAWSYITPYFQPSSAFNYQTNSTGTSEVHIFSGLLAAMPLIIAVIILILGIWALFKRPGPVRRAVFSAAAVVETFSLLNPFNSNYVNAAFLQGNAAQLSGIPLLSLGSFAFLVGCFIIFAAAFLGWQGGKSA